MKTSGNSPQPVAINKLLIAKTYKLINCWNLTTRSSQLKAHSWLSSIRVAQHSLIHQPCLGAPSTQSIALLTVPHKHTTRRYPFPNRSWLISKLSLVSDHIDWKINHFRRKLTIISFSVIWHLEMACSLSYVCQAALLKEKKRQAPGRIAQKTTGRKTQSTR